MMARCVPVGFYIVLHFFECEFIRLFFFQSRLATRHSQLLRHTSGQFAYTQRVHIQSILMQSTWRDKEHAERATCRSLCV